MNEKGGQEGPGEPPQEVLGSAPTAGSEPPDDSHSALTRRPEGDAGLGVRLLLRRLRLLRLLLLAPRLLRLTGRARRRARQERSHGG